MTVDLDAVIRIVYFSGTRGTARAARGIGTALEERGRTVEMAALDQSAANPDPVGDAELYILLYPVYAFGAPLPVHEWIAALPRGEGKSCAVISVSGGGEVWPNTASRVRCIRRLSRKGYNVFYERMLVMPSNIFTATEKPLARELLRVLPLKAAHIADEILSGVRRRSKPPASYPLIALIAMMERLGAPFFGRLLRAGRDCNGCGWCAGHCPRGNIAMSGDRPVFGWRCVICMRCVYGCPRRAIHPSLMGFAPLKEGFSLKKLEASLGETDLLDPQDIRAGALFGGLKDYILDISW